MNGQLPEAMAGDLPEHMVYEAQNNQMIDGGYLDAGVLLNLGAARIKYLVAALEEVAKGMGPYSRDPLAHASNTIEDMKDIATKAVAGTWEVPGD